MAMEPQHLGQTRKNGWQRAIALLLCLPLLWLVNMEPIGLPLAAWAAPADAAATAPTSPAPSPPATNLATDDISAEKVSQFIQAYLQVLALLDEREGDLQAAETQLESRRLEQELESAAFTIIEDAGLTLQEYLQLLGLANTDPDFGERVATQLQEAAP